MRKAAFRGASALAMAFALAQVSGEASAQGGAAAAVNDTIYVTATKKAAAENVQDVPLAITALGAKQLDALKVRDLQSLTYSVPNVSFDDIGTSRGTANFSIRGLGINSSIPSIDPTVGVFVDGMVLGINAGVVFDIFDLQSIEVLRGPQGILFGRNTTGGAVLINTKKPPDHFEVDFKTAVESGLRGTGNNYYVMGSVGGPLTSTLKAKVAAYYNNDRGWFKNYLGGPNLVALVNQIGGTVLALQNAGFPIAVNKPDAFAKFGAAKTWLVRPSVEWTPSDAVDVTVRYEHGNAQGDGPAAQNHVAGNGLPNVFFSAPRDSFTFSVDQPGFYDNSWDQVISEGRLDLGESGVFTNIFGWRQYSSSTLGDIDATPLFLFNASATTDQDQRSEELRYNRRLMDRADLTLGFYYFNQNISYNEIRNLLGGFRFFNGGGVQDQTSIGAFGGLDVDLSSSVKLNLGGRFTHEKKSVVISNLLLNTTPCDVRIPGSCSEDFIDSHVWKDFTPKAGLTWQAAPNFNAYLSWTQGVRSGGFNFRNTSFVFAPGPFDQEKVNAYEIGFKAQPDNGRATINAAFYVNDVNNLQRELNLADPIAGVVQVIRNTADATIWGFEVESRLNVTDNFVLLGNLGHAHGQYDTVKFDLNGDGVLDAADKALKIPRLAPWTGSAGFVYTVDLGDGKTVDTRFNYSHRDRSFYTDSNLGVLNKVDDIDASIALNCGAATLSLYGKNLLNQVQFGGDTQLPASLGGGTFSPLAKGRVVGIELQASFQ